MSVPTIRSFSLHVVRQILPLFFNDRWLQHWPGREPPSRGAASGDPLGGQDDLGSQQEGLVTVQASNGSVQSDRLPDNPGRLDHDGPTVSDETRALPLRTGESDQP